MTLLQQLDKLFYTALVNAGASADCSAVVRPGNRPEFGDYQVNGIMPAAKKMQTDPRKLAQKVVDCLENNALIKSTEIAGPGFINITLSNEWIEETASAFSNDKDCGVEKIDSPETVVVDYSHPNIAKEMAVHHLRSTVIGDAIARALEFLGYNVIRQNHIGDWGTQFGMLIAYMESLENSNDSACIAELYNLEKFYQSAKKQFDSDEAFAEKSRQYVVKLQAGDPWCTEMWKKLIDTTMEQNQVLYERLGISLTPDHIMGESAYNDFLPNIVKDLQNKGLLAEHDGAKLVYLDEFKNKNGESMGVIVQKKDDGYLYSTTDLAAIQYRTKNLHARRIIYCVDARQAQHLQQIFIIARKAGFASENVSLEHHAFGMMLGKDGKPFKTRSGQTIKLADLLDEAELRAAKLLTEKNPQLSEEQKVSVIKALTTGAIKYADLSKNRTSNYVFDWDLMLSFDGNTAPYMLYAYTRIKSIFRKNAIDVAKLNEKIVLTNTEERALALKLLQFNEVIKNVAKEGMPHFLCTYLYELAGNFMSFYECCPVSRQNIDTNVKNSRLQLCLFAANVLKVGLNLLGINTVEQM
ncbi:MAG: arginine--tRNA ligase [Endozoicomonadaceae bacterium]|nr:arginine--tRNA ligase [Endozoicomonadaceae bacterium]